ncbi:hypothetical protein B296_00006005 [Ensete ventricosum]|uniref:Uncharacterized protein n=1 Tax=Ensete ventricosum TaxID=4639 RepID=A0A427AWK6_ENSVE|nr:hypothetical protein B296_00006005 [Ensete ventricosum]
MRSTTAKDEREVRYSTREEEGVIWCVNWKKKPQRETKVETCLDVLEASLEELYQGQGRIFGVESSQEEAESQIDRVESLIDRLMEDTKDSVRHLHEVVAKLTAKVSSCNEYTDPLSNWYVPSTMI